MSSSTPITNTEQMAPRVPCRAVCCSDSTTRPDVRPSPSPPTHPRCKNAPNAANNRLIACNIAAGLRGRSGNRGIGVGVSMFSSNIIFSFAFCTKMGNIFVAVKNVSLSVNFLCRGCVRLGKDRQADLRSNVEKEVISH